MVSCTGGVALMDVDCGNNVLFLQIYGDKFGGYGSITDGIMTVLTKSEHASDVNVRCRRLA